VWAALLRVSGKVFYSCYVKNYKAMKSFTQEHA